MYGISIKNGHIFGPMKYEHIEIVRYENSVIIGRCALSYIGSVPCMLRCRVMSVYLLVSVTISQRMARPSRTPGPGRSLGPVADQGGGRAEGRKVEGARMWHVTMGIVTGRQGLLAPETLCIFLAVQHIMCLQFITDNCRNMRDSLLCLMEKLISSFVLIYKFEKKGHCK